MAARAGPASLAPSALVAAALAACVHPAPAWVPGGDAAAEVMRLDAAWAGSVERADGEAFRSAVAEDAVFAGRALLRGRDEVWAAWKAFFAEGGPRIRWAPTDGGAAGSGDLAWTTGHFHLERRDPSGATIASEGEYLTVWARDEGGAWRATIDGGLEPAEALGPIERAPLRSLASRDGTLEAAVGTWRQDGPSGSRAGAWIAVRDKVAGEWRTRFDSAISFPPAR